jgi:hypothetical protein
VNFGSLALTSPTLKKNFASFGTISLGYRFHSIDPARTTVPKLATCVLVYGMELLLSQLNPHSILSGLVGEGLSGVILSEAAKLKDKIWPKYIRPTLADYNGWSFHSSTPEGKNWFYDLWQSGQDPNNLNWKSWRMPAWVNNYVYKTPTSEKDVYQLLELAREYPSASVFDLAKRSNLQIDTEIMESINDLTAEAFLQEIAADFTEFVGRVFRDFDEETPRHRS